MAKRQYQQKEPEKAQANPMGTGRIEAFSDGVIAIIITIMVLELKIPEHAVHGDLWTEFLGPMAPKLTAYALSFTIVAIYWVNHHAVMHSVRRATTRLLWSNNFLLFWLSLMPLATAFLGEHPFEFRAIVFYALLGFASAFAFAVLRWACISAQNTPQDNATHLAAAKRSLFYACVNLVGIAAWFVSPVLALISFLIPPIAYFLPKRS